MTKQQDYVLQTIEERDVRFVRCWFTDVLGTLKSVVLAPEEVEGAFAEGIGFDGSTIEGLTRRSESDMLLHPDPNTFQVLPWANQDPTARMFCDLSTPDNQPALADPRQVLRRTLQRAEDLGFTCQIHPEVEFYILKSADLEDGKPVPIDNAGYFDNISGGIAFTFRSRAVRILESLGISVEFTHHEGGPGQYEIDLRYADALTMADNLMTVRTVVHEVAAELGVFATFMPKPCVDWPGSGMHSHISLFEGETNAFYEAGAQHQLSLTGRQFIAGMLRHAPEICAVTNQTVNSYKRLWGGDEAPSWICWGHNNSSALIRVPTYKPAKSQSARIEYRAIDAVANPYLAFAVMIEAGLRGIEGEYSAPEEIDGDLRDLSVRERKVLGYEGLPSSLDEAIQACEHSELVASTLGEQLFDYFLDNKRAEWEAYRHQITEIELRTGLTR